MTGGNADHWLPTMTQAFMALDSSTHAISTAEFATAMEKVGTRGARRSNGGSSDAPCLAAIFDLLPWRLLSAHLPEMTSAK